MTAPDRATIERRFRRAFAHRDGYRPHYLGSHFVVGPALAIARDELPAVLHVAGVPVQWDDTGANLIVYPE